MSIEESIEIGKIIHDAFPNRSFKKVEFGGIMISLIENGKVEEDREDYDTLGLMQQIGTELKPKEAGKWRGFLGRRESL